jgi:hypothetical protein
MTPKIRVQGVSRRLASSPGYYNVVTSNCQDYVDNLARMVSHKWWRMSREMTAKLGTVGAVLGLPVAII